MLSIIYSDEFLDHETGTYHPEKPARLTAITQFLKAAPWSDQISWHLPTAVNGQDERLTTALYAVHPMRYVQAVEKLSAAGGGLIDADTIVSARTYEVALLAVNAWLDGVDQVLATGRPSFVLSRP
ncbi:MAG TPA: histone deacetylase, partial [Allocoleopsis sp.]